MALDIARGLHFLHNIKIVHMDLKSPNILLAQDYTAKIGALLTAPQSVSRIWGITLWVCPSLFQSA